MAPRANWKGYLKLSLVSCPITLYPATSSSAEIHFHRINTETGNRLRQQNVDEETGKVLDREHTRRGYEVTKGQYIEVSDEELEEIRIESTHTIDIDNFVPREQVDERYINAPYYIAPTDKVGQEAFAVIRDAIRDMEMARQAEGAEQPTSSLRRTSRACAWGHRVLLQWYRTVSRAVTRISPWAMVYITLLASKAGQPPPGAQAPLGRGHEPVFPPRRYFLSPTIERIILAPAGGGNDRDRGENTNPAPTIQGL
jgi:hypothetical protein